MGMFDNYQNLNPSYIPNNINESLKSYKIFNDSVPKLEYNLKGDIVAYKWNYGDSCNITFSANQVLFVEQDAIIYTQEGDAPNSETTGHLDQKAYNIFDKVCWICKTQDQTNFEWEKLSEFIIPVHGTKLITLDYVGDQFLHSFKLKIIDFRGNIIFEQENDEPSLNIILNISGDLAKKLIPNIYKCIITIDESRVKEAYLNII